jgi:hypothetical protein
MAIRPMPPPRRHLMETSEEHHDVLQLRATLRLLQVAALCQQISFALAISQCS